jgi:hypothetical protein
MNSGKGAVEMDTMNPKAKKEKRILAAFPADLILHNGKIATFDSMDSFMEAVAAKYGRVIKVGNNEEVLALAAPETEVIDLTGRRVLPGLIDSHCHADQHALLLHKWYRVGWPVVKSIPALLDLIHQKTSRTPPDIWFLGFGYNDKKVGGYPTIGDLDKAAGGLPVFILRTDHHVGLANRAACALCCVDRNTPDPPFGQFDRDPLTGELTGLMRETAAHIFLTKARENDTVEDMIEALLRVFNEYLRYGITSIHNSLASSKAIQAYQILRERKDLPLRVGVIVSGREEGLVESYIKAGMRTGFGDEWLRFIGVEWCPDCSTSGRTAAYYEPYVGTPVVGEPSPNYGMLLYEAEDIKARAIAAHKAGLRICMDGVGDRGIGFVLDAFEAALAAHPVKDHRMRVEHCCFVTPKILDRIKRLGVIDSSATAFMYDLGDAYIANRGAENMKWMWPHRALIDAGIPAPGHSDADVCHPNPMRAIYSLVARKTDTGQAIGPEQAIRIHEAIRAYTVLGAYAGNEEEIKGSIEPGKLADMVVLDRDILSVPVEEIKDVAVDLTIVGGIVRYRR